MLRDHTQTIFATYAGMSSVWQTQEWPIPWPPLVHALWREQLFSPILFDSKRSSKGTEFIQEPEVTFQLEEEKPPSLEEMREWLVTHGIYEDGMTTAQIDRRYNVFSAATFGEFAHKPEAELVRDLPHIDWAFVMRVKDG